MRVARLNVPGVVYHLISRLVDRNWFITTDQERDLYTALLGNSLAESDWRCLAYTVMSNHIHLAMIAGFEPLASWLVAVHGPFAVEMNRRHGRLGPMFVRGPKDYAVLPENEGKLIAYLHNNPVRAGVAGCASESSWTSHRAYLGVTRRPPWLHVSEGLARAGFDDARQFDAWVNATPGDAAEVKVDAIRRAARKRGGVEVATPTAGSGEVPLVARPCAHVRPDPRHLVLIAAEVLQISEMTLCSNRRTQIVIAGRRVVVHCGLLLGLSGTEIAAALAISDSAVAQIKLRRLGGADELACSKVLDRVRQLFGVGAVPLLRSA